MPITDEAKSIFQEIADGLDAPEQNELIVKKEKHDYDPNADNERRSNERISDSLLNAYNVMNDMTEAFDDDAESALLALNQLWDD